MALEHEAQDSYSLVVEADEPGGRARFEIQTTIHNIGFKETGTYLIQSPGPDWQFFVDDEPLETKENAWIWKPGFYAGLVRAELIRPDKSLAGTFRLDVSSSPDKLGLDEFQSMLDELWDFNPSLVHGSEPAENLIGRRGDLRTPFLEFARIRQYGDPFVRALRAIAERPIRELRARRDQVLLHQVRRPDRLTAVAAMRNPNTLCALANQDAASIMSGSPPRLDVPLTRESVDGAANRCLLALSQAVAWRAATLMEQIQKQLNDEGSNSTRTSLAKRWPRKRRFLEALLLELRRVHRNQPFSEVTRAEISAAGLNAISADPVYARAHRHAWQILRPGIQGKPSAEMLWLSPTWEIYERWCFVKTCVAMAGMWPDAPFRDASAHPSRASAARTIECGDTVIEILLQPQFQAWDQSTTSDYRSVSGRREPDILVIVDGPTSNACFVLDAKYRTGRSNVLDAAASAHIYRDALRYKGKRIDAALLLTPKAGGARWLEDQAFLEQHRVGIAKLSPNSNKLQNSIIRLLQLNHSCSQSLEFPP